MATVNGANHLLFRRIAAEDADVGQTCQHNQNPVCVGLLPFFEFSSIQSISTGVSCIGK